MGQVVSVIGQAVSGIAELVGQLVGITREHENPAIKAMEERLRWEQQEKERAQEEARWLQAEADEKSRAREWAMGQADRLKWEVDQKQEDEIEREREEANRVRDEQINREKEEKMKVVAELESFGIESDRRQAEAIEAQAAGQREMKRTKARADSSRAQQEDVEVRRASHGSC